MGVNPDWIPMKWPCGPLEVGRRARAQTLTAEVKELLLAWHSPPALEVVKGTPVDCLIVNWAAGAPEDLEQQRTLAPLIAAGRALGISFVGTIAGKQGQQAVLAAGRQAGLSAVLVEEAPVELPLLPVILASPRSKIPWDSTFPLLSVTENRWPGVGLETMQEDVAIAGPTGIPWVDSNGWFSLVAHQLGKGKHVWLDVDPPDTSHSRQGANYRLAVADSQAYGSHWIISLDDKLRLGLIKKDPHAQSLWDEITAAVAFFKEHEEWQAFQSRGVLGVISDFRGKNEDLADEVLNLLGRRAVQYQIIERSPAFSTHLNHLKVIAWLDVDTPGAELRYKLLAFVRQGGLLIVPSSWELSEGQLVDGTLSERYELRGLGRGRTAQSREEFQDPYQVAADIHLLMSRRNDLVRLYNAYTANGYCSVAPTGGRGLVQILNYSSSDPANFVTLWVGTANRLARLWNFPAKQPILIRGVPVSGGTEFELPTLSVYAALEFNDWRP